MHRVLLFLYYQVSDGKITKSERRKITKISGKLPTSKSLSERQKLRLETKAKKTLPKISKEERRLKFGQNIEMEREQNREQFLECLGCRKRGHALKNCPDKKRVVNICFNCSSSEHCLRNCPHPKDPSGKLPYATCFFCNGSGHLSRDCQENPNGLYPKGGCCHICLQKTHLVRDCPMRTEEDIEAHKKRKEMEEDIALGPRIGRVTSAAARDDDEDPSLFSHYGEDDRDSGDEDRGDAANTDRKSDKKKKNRAEKRARRI